MTHASAPNPIGAHPPEPTNGQFTFEEVQLAFRNRGMPLEALRYDITPSGLHYLVVHWDIPEIDSSSWRLVIHGGVRRPVELTLADIKAMPATTLPVTLECAGNGRGRLRPRPVSLPWLHEAIGTAEWTGTPVGLLLDECGIAPDTLEIVFQGADRGIQGGVDQMYARSLPIAEARRPEVILAYEMNGRPLEPQHGFPLRLVVPGWYGMTSVKWLQSIEAVAKPFCGFQQVISYHYQRGAEDPGVAVNRIRVRSLMAPPGRTDFFTRQRFLSPGHVVVKGRAWSGNGPVKRVEVALDGAWSEATLRPAVGKHAWCEWSWDWEATSGVHELACRATDVSDNVQPLEQPWNYQGFGNNMVQSISVVVA